MATRESLRDWLRRRLQELTPAQWDDTDLDSYINFGYQFTQEEIEAVENDAFAHYTDKTDLVAGQQLYPLPVNCKAPRLLEMSTNGGTSYSVIEQVGWPQTVPQPTEAQQIEPQRARTVWSLQGRYIRLEPTPQTSHTDGLRLTYVPVLTMGADSDVPELTANYHANIVFYAQVLALGDTANTQDKAAALEDLALFAQRLPNRWLRTIAQAGGAPPISVAPRIKYGPNATLYDVPNDWDSRNS